MGRRKISTIFTLICVLVTGFLVILNVTFDGVFSYVLRNSFNLPKLFNNNQQLFGGKFGCILPKVDPFDPAIKPFLTNLTLNCNKSLIFTVVDEEQDKLLVKLNKKQGDFDCYYSWVKRKGADDSVSYDDVKLIPEKGILMDNKHMIANTSCINKETNNIFYRNIHYHIPNFQSTLSSSSSSLQSNHKPSVVILVIESMSRLSFQRFLPKTAAILTEIGEFQHLYALSRVQENSFPNSMALLTGLPVTDNAASMFPGIRWDNALPYVWDEYKANGYVTGFLEDQPMVGLFSYYNRGFRSRPTDFYPVEFWSHMYPDGKAFLYDLLVNPINYCYEKVGSKVSIFLEMCQKFSQRVFQQKLPHFLYAFYAQVTHENFNNFQLVDEPVAQYIASIESLLKQNVIFMLIGDHGPRQGESTNTPYGRLEGSLPFAAIRIPETLNEKYPHLRKYLSLNENRLSTWFDVHAMLLDIAQGNFSPIGPRKDVPKAYSLFREEVPITRDCNMANVPQMFCACNGKVGINPKFKSHHIEAARGLVENLRTIFRKNKCYSIIKYGETLSGEYYYPEANEKFSTNEKVKLAISVIPNKAVITSTVYRWRNSTESTWTSWKIYDPENKLNSKAYTSKLTKLLCTRYVAKNTTVTIP